MIRWALSWMLYGLGDLVSRCEREHFTLYPLSNRLLHWSDAVQGDGSGPWEDAA